MNTTKQTKTGEARFLAFVDRNYNGCWNWTASRDRWGYGQFMLGKMMKAHRAAWILYRGPIPSRQCVLHKCDNPACVRPTHLFLGSVADNNHDMARKGRANSKLSWKEVREIRASSGTCQAVARAYGISASQVSRIRTHKKWKHI